MSLIQLSPSNGDSLLINSGAFSTGKIVRTRNELVFYTDQYNNRTGYRWLGQLPHTISGNSPLLDGGISSTAWESYITADLYDKLKNENITLTGTAHLPTVEVAYGLERGSLNVWVSGNISSSSNYWLYSDGTVWGGVGTLGNTPTTPFTQIHLQRDILKYNYTVPQNGDTQITVPYDFSSVVIFVNGVLQSDSINAFFINGRVITFSSVLNKGDNIQFFFDNVPISSVDYALKSDLSLYCTLEELSSVNGSALIGLENGGTVQDAITWITPEMFGAVGDGITSDYSAIQSMLDTSPDNSVFLFSSSKTYFNDFSIGSITISKPCTIYFNNAKLTRAASRKSIDEQTSLIYINETENVKLFDLNLDGNNPVGYPFKSDGTQQTTGNKTSLSEAINYGVYIRLCDNVTLTGKIQKCAFNIWAKSSTKLDIDMSLDYGGQVTTQVTSTDLAYGAGIKVSDCTGGNIIVNGTGNANASVEMEPNANNFMVDVISIDNLSSGLTITNSKSIKFRSTTKNCSIGTQLTQGGSYIVEDIMGESSSEGCSWGFLINLQSSATKDMGIINARVNSYRCRSQGLYLLNQNTSKSINNTYIHYMGVDNFVNTSGSSGNDVIISGDYRGLITGSSSGCYNGVLVSGTQSQSVPPQISMDLRGTVSSEYYISPGCYADLSGTKGKTKHLISAAPNFTSALLYRSSSADSKSNLTDIVMYSDHYYRFGMTTTPTFANEEYKVLNGTNYDVKIKGI